MRAAHLPTSKSLESVDFAFHPTLAERLIPELGTLGFVPTATTSVLLGPPGVGKTHVALALTARTLEAGYSARFTTRRQLADELETTSWRQQRRRALRPRLLVSDEVGSLRLTASHAQQLFDRVTARYEQAPIVLTSNRSFAEWGTLLGDDVLATALPDRLLHQAEGITMNGQRYRMKDRRLSEPSPPVVLADAGARKEDEHLRLVGQRSSSPRSLTRSIDPGLLFPSGSGSIRHHWVSMPSPLTFPASAGSAGTARAATAASSGYHRSLG